MLRSLRQYDPDSFVYIFALSDLCAEILREHYLPNVKIIPLKKLEGAFPELLSVRPTRSLIEYYFTLTPTLPLYVFETTQADYVTYIDSDLYFYSSPGPLWESIMDSSIAITPHNYSKDFPGQDLSGEYNVGWVTYRRCDEAVMCLEKYKSDCIEWCYDRPDKNGRFADQGYLDKWPELYHSLKIIKNKGVNVALWNANDYVFEERGKEIFVQGERLVFYHFHGVKKLEDGRMYVPIPPKHHSPGSVLVRRIIQPYMEELINTRHELHVRYPIMAESETPIR